MADLSRTFKKSTILNLLEGDSNNGNPDGDLNLDSPDYTIVGIRLLSNPIKKVIVELEFNADQGSLTIKHGRFLTFIYADLPNGAKTKVKDFYNWVTDSVIKVLPELADGVEQ
jgi:hypothetical protein